MKMKSDDETSNTKTIQENDVCDDKHDDNDKFGNSSSNQPESYEIEKKVIDISNKNNDDINMEDISFNSNSNSDNSKDNTFLNTKKNESKGTYDTSKNKTQTGNIFVDTSEDDNKDTIITVNKNENNDTIDKLLSSNKEKDTTLTFSKSESNDVIEKPLSNDLNKHTTLNKSKIEDNNSIEISLSSNMDKHITFTDIKSDDNDTIEKSLGTNNGKHNDVADQSLDSSKESEVENVDAIKKFIEDQEKEIQIQEKVAKKQKHISVHNKVMSESEPNEPENRVACVMVNNELIAPLQQQSESLTIASNLMDIVLNQSEVEIDSKMDIKDSTSDSFSTEEKGNSGLALKIGSEIEARHFDEYWYPAKIVEVDYEEMEVLIHYENVSKKHDEWISVSSPRLRPLDSLHRSVKSDVEASPRLTPIDLNKTNETCRVDTYDKINLKEEPADEKSKLLFVVGERCLARWRDNRRFLATIQKDLGDGQYEIMFDDGFHWTCSASRLYKYKESMGRNADPLIIGPSSSFPSSSNLSPTNSSSPSSNTVISNISKIPPYHKHLFDPTRDYLGSKSERREMKRKLNIKEIFNIGQKRRKVETMPTAPYKSEKSKKPNIIKKKVTDAVNKTEIKREIPDAVASIIGTIDTCEGETPYKKLKIKVKENLNINETDVCNDIKDKQQNETKISELGIKKELDPIEEEKELERFEVQDEDKHVEVIDKIKEVIIKLEDVINKDKKLDSSTILSKQKSNTTIDKNMESDSTGDNNEDVLLCPASVLKEDRLESFKNLKNDTEDNLDTENNVAKVELVSSTETVDESKNKKSDSVEINPVTNNSNDSEKIRKKLWKIKKGKKLRLLQEKKVKKQVEKVKSELEEMKKQMEQMKKEMILKTAELANRHQSGEMPESFLLPGEWCCKWVNGQPLGTVSEVEMEVKVDSNNKPVLPRRSVQVEDKRLPPGWTKHMVRRSFGNSAGKWDVVLVSPENRRLHTRSEMRNYLEHTQDESLKEYEHALYDFGVHLKLARRMGWVTNTPDGAVEEPVSRIPSSAFSSSPIVKRPFISHRKTKLGLKKRVIKVNTKKKFIRPAIKSADPTAAISNTDKTQSSTTLMNSMDASPTETLEDGYVFVGSLKVQVIDNLLRCPAEGCFKNFRNNTLIKMHIKHYHRDLIKMLGATPKVLDLAYARTVPNKTKLTKQKSDSESKIIKVKLPKVTKREDTKHDIKDISSELQMTLHAIQEPVNDLESIKHRSSLLNRPVKRPRVLLPVRRPDPPEEVTTAVKEDSDLEQKEASNSTSESVEPLDFETAISTHTVTRPAQELKKKSVKLRSFASFSRRPMSEEDEWCGMNSDVETRSSYPRSGTPDSKILDIKGDSLNHPLSSESNEEQKEHMYTFTETGERIKIVHMKREEIINCHCGVREEDGLMVQCELCLCWQHALCHNIHKESEVPEKYTCSICLNPRRGRRSARFVHDQDRLYEGLLPGAKPCETLRRSHELSGNLLRIQDALHALRVKYYVATKKNHPKLYLWAKDWENGELNLIQEKLNSDYSDLNIMISDIGKENLPVKPEELKDMPPDIRSSPLELQDNDGDRYSQREGQMGSQSLLCGLLSSPGGASLDLPISATDFETLAKSVPERIEVGGPQPEAAIENSACRERLLRHIQRCQAIIDSRLDSIEAQVAELESQDPLFEDDETADYFPRTKQTVQMLLRDLETMEELGIIT